MYSISTIESYNKFLELESEWETLRLRNSYTLFSSHPWYKCLLSSCQKSTDLFIVIVRCSLSREVVGILPLKKAKKYHLTGLIGFVNSDTHRFDFVCERSFQKDVLIALFNFLSNLKGVHYLELAPIAGESSPLFEFLSNNIRGSLDVIKKSPYLPCNQTFEEIFNQRSKISRKNTRNLINRFSKLGEVCIERLSHLSERDFNDCLLISDGSWKGADGVAIGSSETTEKFFRALTAISSEYGWLRVTFLRVNGERVAMEYHLREDNIEYALRGDYLLPYKEYSPGKYLNYFVISGLCDENDVEIYDMCGDQYDYKKKWTKFTDTYYRALWITDNRVLYLYKIKKILNKFKN